MIQVAFQQVKASFIAFDLHCLYTQNIVIMSKNDISQDMIANNLTAAFPTHPGEILKDEIEYRGISQCRLAKDMGIAYSALNEILNCRRPDREDSDAFRSSSRRKCRATAPTSDALQHAEGAQRFRIHGQIGRGKARGCDCAVTSSSSADAVNPKPVIIKELSPHFQTRLLCTARKPCLRCKRTLF